MISMLTQAALAVAISSSFVHAMPSTRTLYLGIQGGKVDDKDGWLTGDSDTYCKLTVGGQTKTSPQKDGDNTPTFNWFNQNFGKQNRGVSINLSCIDNDSPFGSDNLGSVNFIATSEWDGRNRDSSTSYKKISLSGSQYMFVQITWELVKPDPPAPPEQTTKTLHEIGLKWNSASVTFDGGTSITGWQVQYKLQGTNTWGSRDVAASVNQFTLTGLKDSDTYVICSFRDFLTECFFFFFCHFDCAYPNFSYVCVTFIWGLSVTTFDFWLKTRLAGVAPHPR